MSILIKNVQLNNSQTDLLITKNRIVDIAEKIDTDDSLVIDGGGKAVIPGFLNGHTHAAMTLFRGYADDIPLHEWLEQKIWPLEQKLTEDDVYWGTRLACLEMIKSGTTFFNDMYWHLPGSARAVEEMGVRASLSSVFIDMDDKVQAEKQVRTSEKLFEQSKNFSDRVKFSLGPHAIYTVSEESLRWIKDFADKNDLLIHIHVSETKKEVDDCIKKHGKRPLEYLDQIGFLGSNVILCHAVWLSDTEIDICKKRNAKIVYNPTSNLKLTSGICFQYQKMVQRGIRPLIGTDGCASNNNLDILESLKIASILQKSYHDNPTVLSAHEAIEMATSNAAIAFGLDTGKVAVGKLADLSLIDLKRPELVPNHNLNANLVYSANGSCVDTVICDGKILMQNRKVKDEDIILEKAQQVARNILKR